MGPFVGLEVVILATVPEQKHDWGKENQGADL
jgi:hypothetical protein